jgi:ADP-heptose:LPS heptosyltransferase
MKIITFGRKVTVITRNGAHNSEVSANPGERLIFDNENALTIQQNPDSARYIYEITDLNPLLAELPAPKSWTKMKVLFFRNRGIGDQLIASAGSRYFRETLGADSHQLCDRVHEPLWAYNPYIGGSALIPPLHLDAVWRAKKMHPFFDKAFFIESLTEWDNDSEQPNVYDRLFAMLGIRPETVSPKFKRPTFALQQEDIETRINWLRQVAAATDKSFENGYVFVQLRATNKPRSLPQSVIEKVLYAANEFAAPRQLPVLVTDDQPLEPAIAKLVLQTPSAINVATAINSVRLLGSLIAGASLIIGPDSSSIHFAAAFETPTIGIWGPFDPACRTAYYPNQIHLWHRQLCKHSPCYNYLPELPIQKCPRGQAQTTCEVFAGVTVEEIETAIAQLVHWKKPASKIREVDFSVTSVANSGPATA